jgi:hypothetical protein
MRSLQEVVLFRKKESKNFNLFIGAPNQRREGARQKEKVFWFFFSKKNDFLCA